MSDRVKVTRGGQGTSSNRRARVAGVDGTKGGWVAVVLEDGTLSAVRRLAGVDASFEELADADVIAIDVPIGFGPREAEGRC